MLKTIKMFPAEVRGFAAVNAESAHLLQQLDRVKEEGAEMLRGVFERAGIPYPEGAADFRVQNSALEWNEPDVPPTPTTPEVTT